MAGIGFEIRRLSLPRSFTGTLQAYLFAGVISTGPWLISILSIILLNRILQPILDDPQRQLFSTTLTHSYAVALILTGGLQYVLNRHASDLLCQHDRSRIYPSAIGALTLTAGLSLVVGTLLFGLGTTESLLFRIAAISLFVYVSLIFVTANYLSVLSGFRRIVTGFAIGYGIACVAAWYGARHGGLEVGLAGFAAGHLLLFAFLLASLRREIGSRDQALADWHFLGHFRRFPGLLWCGLLYQLGIWIDKFLFWRLSEEHQVVSGILHASPEYDLAIYLSLLSIVPGLTILFLRLETDFAAGFHRFFEATNGGGRLGDILATKNEMIEALRSGFLQLLSVQALFTLSLLVFADRIGNWIGIGAIQEGIFRVTLIGAFLLMLFLALLTILFYLDDRRGALMACLAFAAANGGLSLATLLANEAWYGFGFVVASGIALFIAAWRVNARIARLEYHVFLPDTA